MELLEKIVNDAYPLTIFAKHSILQICQGSEYTTEDYCLKFPKEGSFFLL